MLLIRVKAIVGSRSGSATTRSSAEQLQQMEVEKERLIDPVINERKSEVKSLPKERMSMGQVEEPRSVDRQKAIRIVEREQNTTPVEPDDVPSVKKERPMEGPA